MQNKHYNEVLEFATKAHGEQKRKYTLTPYIEHPKSVANLIMKKLDDYKESQVYAALLHDVLEDTQVTPVQLYDFLKSIMNPELALETFEIVHDLTDLYTTEAYPHKNRKWRKMQEAIRLGRCSKITQEVKYADLTDNGISIELHDPKFAKTYNTEKDLLLFKMDRGSLKLYTIAKSTI